MKELPESSIAIKTQDKSSDGMKTIAKNADELGSKLRELQDKVHALSKEKAMLISINCGKAEKRRPGLTGTPFLRFNRCVCFPLTAAAGGRTQA